MAVFAGTVYLRQQRAGSGRVIGFTGGQLGEVHHSDQGIVELMGDLADHRAQGGKLFNLQDTLMFGTEAQKLVLEIVLTLVIALYPVEGEIEKAQHTGAGEQAQQRHRRDRPHKRLLQRRDVAHHHQVADAAPSGIVKRQHGQMQYAVAVLEYLGTPGAQAGEDAVVQGRWHLPGGLRHRHMGAKAIPTSLPVEQSQSVMPLLRQQETLVHQHKQVHRQAVADFLHEILDLFADLEIAEDAIATPPWRHQPQRERPQRSQLEPVHGFLLVPRLGHRRPLDQIAKLARTMQAQHVDQVGTIEVEMRDAMVGAQGLEQWPGFAYQRVAVETGECRLDGTIVHHGA